MATTESKERPRDGLRCPALDCGSERTEVLRTWFRKHTHDVKRRHRCKACGRRFSSLQGIVASKAAEFSS
jgi:transcriptional regulator NrdR family protein